MQTVMLYWSLELNQPPTQSIITYSTVEFHPEALIFRDEGSAIIFCIANRLWNKFEPYTIPSPP